MHRRILNLVILTSLAVLQVESGFGQTETQLRQWLKQFPGADFNKDGVLSREEARKYRDEVLSKQLEQARRNRIAPTHANVKYGSHDRNVFDVWLPDSANGKKAKPIPVFVYFHGGGFVAGDKSSFDPAAFLSDGMAVVSANYRFVDGDRTLSPAPLLDSARVVQYLRSRAKEWGLDKKRIALSGSSAGAVISMWIGYHDDLADPSSNDSVARQSTRVKCIVPLNGPANLDPRWITRNMGGPKHIHGSFPKMFGAAVADSDAPEVRKRILESSPFEHVSADDPPSLLIYSGSLEGIPLPESASTGVLIHHAFFGKALKARLDDLGIENQFLHGSDPRRNSSAVIRSWLKQHLFAETSASQQQ